MAAGTEFQVEGKMCEKAWRRKECKKDVQIGFRGQTSGSKSSGVKDLSFCLKKAEVIGVVLSWKVA